MKTTIKTLYQQGYNKSQIARLLGIDRKTVRNVLKGPDNPSSAKETAGEETKKTRWPSVLDEYREYIQIQAAKDLSVTRIHQGLAEEYGLSVGYSTVRDYVSKLRRSIPKAYMVLHALPGEEAQVDFGYAGIIPVGGKPRKAWVFAMSLSYSRYMYAEITPDQSVRTFIMCHIHAFRFFGGVPQTVKIDNLKAAITAADFYEPLVQRAYADFANHYGFLPNPCRVYTPTDKGKIESNIKYIKENCLKGREFADAADAQVFLEGWLSKTANRRVHGTTAKIPAEAFMESESPKLLPLPDTEYVFSNSKRVTVWTDCHVSYQGNYYSAPYSLIGCEVTVMESNGLVKIYHEGKEVALHPLVCGKKGEHVTDRCHYPSNKNITQAEALEKYRSQMAGIGAGAEEFLAAFEGTMGQRFAPLRSLAGITSLRKKYGDAALDMACARAVHYGNISYRAVKGICEKGLYCLPLDDGCQGAPPARPKARSLDEYSGIFGLGVIAND
jgi:transposase